MKHRGASIRKVVELGADGLLLLFEDGRYAYVTAAVDEFDDESAESRTHNVYEFISAAEVGWGVEVGLVTPEQAEELRAELLAKREQHRLDEVARLSAVLGRLLEEGMKHV